eukprot:5319974-Prymnesium_polylepis.1
MHHPSKSATVYYAGGRACYVPLNRGGSPGRHTPVLHALSSQVGARRDALPHRTRAARSRAPAACARRPVRPRPLVP